MFIFKYRVYILDFFRLFLFYTLPEDYCTVNANFIFAKCKSLPNNSDIGKQILETGNSNDNQVCLYLARFVCFLNYHRELNGAGFLCLGETFCINFKCFNLAKGKRIKGHILISIKQKS